MGKLRGHLCYCAGPMEHVDDMGISWRQEITPKLQAMGIGVLNPCDKATDYALENPETNALINAAKNREDWNEVHNILAPIVGADLRQVHHAAFIILYIDKDAHMCGSYIEYAWAMLERKPVLCVVKQGKRNASGFIFGMNPHNLIFNTFDEALDYLREIDEKGDVNNLRRWTLFDMSKVFGKELFLED